MRVRESFEFQYRPDLNAYIISLLGKDTIPIYLLYDLADGDLLILNQIKDPVKVEEPGE